MNKFVKVSLMDVEDMFVEIVECDDLFDEGDGNGIGIVGDDEDGCIFLYVDVNDVEKYFNRSVRLDESDGLVFEGEINWDDSYVFEFDDFIVGIDWFNDVGICVGFKKK